MSYLKAGFHMIADDHRPYCDLRSAICDPRSYGNQPLFYCHIVKFTSRYAIGGTRRIIGPVIKGLFTWREGVTQSLLFSFPVSLTCEVGLP